MKATIPLTFDEAFKDEMRNFFEPFAKVITNYEIIDLPKKVDLLIIELDHPIKDNVKIFTYFKRFNIIEFKSERNRFRLTKDLYILLIYIAGILSREKEAEIDTTTFTLVTSLKPVKFFKKYNAVNLRQGLYKIDNISLIPIHIVVIEELEIEFDNELEILKEFTSIKDRELYIKRLLNLSINKPTKYDKQIDNVGRLYTKELDKIAKKEGINMTIVEKNFKEWAEESGYKDQLISIGIEKGIEKGVEKGIKKGFEKGVEKNNIEIIQMAYESNYSIEEIIRLTRLSKEKVLSIINSFKK